MRALTLTRSAASSTLSRHLGRGAADHVHEQLLHARDQHDLCVRGRRDQVRGRLYDCALLPKRARTPPAGHGPARLHAAHGGVRAPAGHAAGPHAHAHERTGAPERMQPHSARKPGPRAAAQGAAVRAKRLCATRRSSPRRRRLPNRPRRRPRPPAWRRRRPCRPQPCWGPPQAARAAAAGWPRARTTWSPAT